MDVMRLKAVLGLDSSEYEEGMKKSGNEVEKFGKRSSVVFGAFMEIGRRAAGAVMSSITSNIDGAVSRFDTLNNFSKIMQAVGFSADQADKSINDLANGITYLPTTLDAVASETKQIAAATGDLEGATKLTLALNNALAAGGVAGAEAQGAIEQWTQAISKGEPDYREWLRMVQSSPAQMDQLSKYMLGAEANSQSLWAAIKDGTISIGELDDAMIKLSEEDFEIDGKQFESWAKQAEKASAGIEMSMINTKAAIQRNIANIMSLIDEQFGENFIANTLDLSDEIDSIGESIKGLLKGDISIGELLSFDPSGITSKIDEALPVMIEKGLEWAEGFTTSLREGFGNLIDGGIEIIQHIAQGIATAMPALIEKVPTIVSNIAGLINDNAPKLIKAAFNIIVTLGKGLIDALPTLIANLPKIIKAIWDVLTAFNWVALGRTVIQGIAGGIAKAGSSIWSNIKTIGAKAVQAFKNIDWSNAGRSIITGIINGLKGAGGMLLNAAKNVAKSVLNTIKAGLGIHSPSRVFRDEVGKNIVLGLAEGIEDGEGVVSDAMASLNDSIATNMFEPISDGYSYVTSTTSEDTMYGSPNSAVSVMQSLIDALANARIEVVTNLDGKEIARTTAPFMNDEINRRQMLANRKLGYV